MSKRLEEETKRLVAFKRLTSSTGSFSDRTKRTFEKIREDIGRKLKERPELSLPDNSRLSLKLGWSDESVAWARKINLGIKEFSQAYPEWGIKLQEHLDKHKNERRAFLEFGGEVEEEIYIGIIQNMFKELDYDGAKNVYRLCCYLESVLGKDEDVYRSILSE